jgi:hypothetical protein
MGLRQTPVTENRAPHLGALAIAYALLFNLGLAFVTYLAPPPRYPAPGASTSAIVGYFAVSGTLVRISDLISIGAFMVLGVLVVGLAGRLRLLGDGGSGPAIALFAGLMTALDQTASHLSQWAITWPGIGQGATLALYYLSYAFGGPGFSVPMGVFIGAVALTARSSKLLPRWIVWSGMAIALTGLVSSLNILAPTLSPLPLTIPLTRFPAFLWLIAAGFALPLRRRSISPSWANAAGSLSVK